MMRRHFAVRLECSQHLIHCFAASQVWVDAGAIRDPGIFFSNLILLLIIIESVG